MPYEKTWEKELVRLQAKEEFTLDGQYGYKWINIHGWSMATAKSWLGY